MQFRDLTKRVIPRVLKRVKWLFGAAGKSTGPPPWSYYALHYGAVFLVISLLGGFSDRLINPSEVTSSSPFVRRYYAGILALVFYLFVRCLIFLISLFWRQEESEFGDIDEAWGAGLEALKRAGLDIQSLPLFLVVGLAERDEPHFFLGAKWDVVAPSMERKGSPLRFYANQKALFVACSNVSTICSQVDVLPVGMSVLNAAAGSQNESQMGKGYLAPVQEADAYNTLEPGQLAGLSSEMPGVPVGSTIPAVQSGRVLLASELLACKKRQQYLCGLILNARAPFCPINGLLAAVPLEWVRSTADPGLHNALEQDVRVLHESFQLMFPVTCLLTGLHQIGGVYEFVERVRKAEPRFGPNVRAGTSFPMGLALDDDNRVWLIDKGLEWFHAWVSKAFSHDPTNPSD